MNSVGFLLLCASASTILIQESMMRAKFNQLIASICLSEMNDDSALVGFLVARPTDWLNACQSLDTISVLGRHFINFSTLKRAKLRLSERAGSGVDCWKQLCAIRLVAYNSWRVRRMQILSLCRAFKVARVPNKNYWTTIQTINFAQIYHNNPASK